MSKNIRIIYLYVVSFIALAMIVSGVIFTVNSIAAYNYPQVYYYSYYNDDVYEDKETDSSYNYNEELLKRISEERRSSLRDIYSYISVVVVGVPLFLYHWNKIQKETKEEGAN